jgi:hypothetical protein
MSDSHSNAEQPAGSGSRSGYGLPNKAAPLPRQWQLPRPQTPVPRSQAGVQHLYPGLTGAGTWQKAAPSRRMERAILLGLWFLVMLAAIAIGLRILDLSTSKAPPGEPASLPLSSADAATAMRSAALVAARNRGVDPFDDPFEDRVPLSLPEPLPARPPSPTRLSTPAPLSAEAPSRPVARLSAADTLTVERPVAATPADPARKASSSPVCADALRAMQLCPDTR